MRRLRLRFPDGGGGAQRAGYVVMMLGAVALAGVLYEFNMAVNESGLLGYAYRQH